MKIGANQRQSQGFSAFIPEHFPPKSGWNLSPPLLQKGIKATQLIGKLDGITQLLPDIDFFLLMYIRKDAADSSQIEGTRATLADAIAAEANVDSNLPDDVDDILHYIDALNYGHERLEQFPLSIRFIKELHKELMTEARSNHHSNPGEFRTSQNWIGGTSPSNAAFVPPPPHEINRTLGDLENFMRKESYINPLIKIALIHAQFETIHPFLDGNGRTGRLLITFCLSLSELLERPVLFLSSFFQENKKLYYEKLQGYRDNEVEQWIDFFLDGIIDTAEEAISTVRQITHIREEDILKIQSLGKRESESSIKVLPRLFGLPIVNAAKIQEWTGFTRAGAGKVIKRFVELGILEQRNKNEKYSHSYIYRKYFDVF
ncbi:MAG: Fic family protein [Candidatus Peribacteraceae bacterium]|nr:Fic family protein [Candidatus Peribacteraceae bacterium]